MNQVPTPFFVTIVDVIAAIITLIGVWLLWKGLGPKGLFPGFALHDVSLVKVDRSGAPLSASQRSWRRQLLGGLLILFSLSIAAGINWMQRRQINPVDYKPFAWLLFDVNRTTGAERDLVLRVLDRRYASGNLNRSQRAAFAALRLKVSGAAGQPWHSPWPDLLDKEQAAGNISAAAWSGYLSQTPVQMEVSGNPIKRGDGDAPQLFLEVASSLPRVGHATAQRTGFDFSGVQLDIDGLPMHAEFVRAGKLALNAVLVADCTSLSSQLAEGLHRVHVGGNLLVKFPLGVQQSVALNQNTAVRVENTFAFDHHFIHASDAQSAVEKALHVSLKRSSKGWFTDSLILTVTIDTPSLPVDVSFAVNCKNTVVGDDYAGQLDCKAHGQMTWHSTQELLVTSARSVEIDFFPNIHQQDCWDGAVIKKDVPIEP